MKTKRPQTGYKSNSRRAPVDTDAGKTGLFYLYRVEVDAATVFIAERLYHIAENILHKINVNFCNLILKLMV